MAEITIDAADGSGSFTAYISEPAAQTRPAVVAIQEIFGINQVMRDICDGLAAQGYLAVCPDLFWRQEPGIELTDQSEAEWARAFELYQGFDEAKGVDDLGATIAAAREFRGSTGNVGTVGYCLGGKLAYLCATRTDATCNVGYYGVAIEAALDEAPSIRNPLLLHIAEKDQFCPPEAQAQIKQHLAGHAAVTIHSYSGVDHAFARPGGAHFDQAAADIANQRSRAFLAEHLS